MTGLLTKKKVLLFQMTGLPINKEVYQIIPQSYNLIPQRDYIFYYLSTFTLQRICCNINSALLEYDLSVSIIPQSYNLIPQWFKKGLYSLLLKHCHIKVVLLQY